MISDIDLIDEMESEIERLREHESALLQQCDTLEQERDSAREAARYLYKWILNMVHQYSDWGDVMKSWPWLNEERNEY